MLTPNQAFPQFYWTESGHILKHTRVLRGEQNFHDQFTLTQHTSWAKGVWASPKTLSTHQGSVIKKKLRKAVAADTNGSDLTTGVLCFYQGLKGHLKYIVNWMTEYILNTYNLTGTGHHNHSWNEKINDIALALKDVFIICLGWREVRRKMFPSTFGM